MNNDLRFAFRQLLKNPGFTAVAVLTLALGIGANTAIFRVLDAVLLRMLPVRNPEELRSLNHAGGDRSGNGFVSHRFWQGRFGGNPSVIGRTIALNGTPFTVIGITPPEFFGMRVGRSDAITIPITLHPRMMPGAPFLQDPRNWDAEVIGRLKPARSEAEAAAALKVFFQRIEFDLEGGQSGPERMKTLRDRRIDLVPASKGLSELRRKFSTPLHILMIVVGLVLLIACANFANLLLARASARRKETAIRLAVGAGRGRIIRQLLTENLLLALLGGAAGLLFANWISAFCVALISDRFGAIALNLSPDLRVLSYTLTVSAFTGIIFGLLPAWQAARFELTPMLKEGARDPGGHRPSIPSPIFLLRCS